MLERPREWLLERMTDEDRQEYWGDFLVCPWCAGFWLSGVVYGAWLLTLGHLPSSAEEAFVGVGVWFAISALVGMYGLVVEVLQPRTK